MSELLNRLESLLEDTQVNTPYVPKVSWGAGFWISPSGEAVPVHIHIDAVTGNPEKFGYTREELEQIFAEHGEKYGTEGRARETILLDLIAKGWIRVRHYRNKGFTVNVGRDTKQAREHVTMFFIALHRENPKTVGPYEDVKYDTPQGVQTFTVKQVAGYALFYSQREALRQLQFVAQPSGLADWIHESLGAGFWLSPTNQVIRVETDHAQTVLDKPELFRMTDEEIDKLYTDYGEQRGNIGDAQEELMTNVVAKGFIRIRFYGSRGWNVKARDDREATLERITYFFIDLLEMAKGQVNPVDEVDLLLGNRREVLHLYEITNYVLFQEGMVPRRGASALLEWVA